MDCTKAMENLEQRLEKIESFDLRKKVLRSVYRQVFPGKKSGRMREGDYNVLVRENPQRKQFIFYLEQKLEGVGMLESAKNLADFYANM
jgi:hypothetical protein